MAQRAAPELYYSEKRQAYRKRLKNPATGAWDVEVWGKTKAECREKAALRAAELSDAAAEAADGLRVYQYAKTWYELNTVHLSPSGRASHRNAINNHICPVIGTMRMTDVKADDGKSVMLAAAGLSKATQQKIVTTLKMIFAAAEDSEIIPRSPFRGLKAGGEKPDGKEPLTKDQRAALLAAVKGKDIETFVLLGLYLGLRREEALGLLWDSVYLDVPTPYVHVRRALRWENNRPVLSDKLKSKAAYRKLPIPPPLLDHLRALPRKGDYVCHRADGKAHSESSYRRAWETVTEQEIKPVTYKSNRTGEMVTRELAAGDKVPYRRAVACLDFHTTPHVLRHTYITELFMSGADIKTVQYLAGHSSVKITLDIYTHLMANQPKDTAAAVLAAFGLGGQASGAELPENPA